ncbi:hypothetical protein ON010_g5077 [Phytophthora cinnamomi]|nr:hypothetical protein ON010_g5077 [Phytophthora cinnamomi]
MVEEEYLIMVYAALAWQDGAEVTRTMYDEQREGWCDGDEWWVIGGQHDSGAFGVNDELYLSHKQVRGALEFSGYRFMELANWNARQQWRPIPQYTVDGTFNQQEPWTATTAPVLFSFGYSTETTHGTTAYSGVPSQGICIDTTACASDCSIPLRPVEVESPVVWNGVLGTASASDCADEIVAWEHEWTTRCCVQGKVLSERIAIDGGHHGPPECCSAYAISLAFESSSELEAPLHARLVVMEEGRRHGDGADDEAYYMETGEDARYSKEDVVVWEQDTDEVDVCEKPCERLDPFRSVSENTISRSMVRAESALINSDMGQLGQQRVEPASDPVTGELDEVMSDANLDWVAGDLIASTNSAGNDSTNGAATAMVESPRGSQQGAEKVLAAAINNEVINLRVSVELIGGVSVPNAGAPNRVPPGRDKAHLKLSEIGESFVMLARAQTLSTALKTCTVW